MKRKFYFLNRILRGAFLLAFMTFSSFSTEAQTVYHVSTTGNDNDSGLSWVTPLKNIQTALDLAVPGDEIWVAMGTYYPDEGTGQTNNERASTFTLKPGVRVLGGFIGVSGAIIPRDPEVFPTILSGDLDQNDGATLTGLNSYHVVTGEDTATLDGFTITAGLATGTGTDQDKGGGIFNNGTSPSIANCIVENNVALEGGGMYNRLSINSFEVRNVTFRKNSCNTGGAVYNENSDAKFFNCLFEENSAPQGGAIYNTGSNPVGFINCVIAGNFATQEGGGIYNTGTPLTIINSTITGNKADIEAGGLFLNDTNLGVFQNTIIWNNMANNATNLASSSLTQTNSTLNFANCLVENFTPQSQGGTTGILFNTSPSFVLNLAPSTAPNSGGDFRLLQNSNALNVGDNTLNTELFDFLGNLRIQDNTIDLGAIEGSYSRIYYVSAAFGNDNNIGLSWGGAYKTLQAALNNAVANDVIWVEKGTYYPDEGTGQINDDRASTFTLKEDVKIYGGFFGNETALGERDLENNETILSGDLDQNDAGTPTGNNAYHVVSHANGFSRGTVIDGFTIKGGLANGTDARDKKGGGMILEFADLIIQNCHITGNEAQNDGGGIYDESCTFLLTNSRLSGNTALNGGGIFNIFDAAPEITHTTFNGNTATSGAGAFNTQALPSYKNCVFELNSATVSGGGMLNDTASGDVINTIFRGNSAANGAGAYNINFASPFFTNCLFSGNNASSTGGAMDNSVDAAPTLTNCTLSGNSATSDGGGIYNSSVNITVQNTIVWNNSSAGATNTATASILDDGTSTTTFTKSLIANFTVSGGIIANSDPMFVGPLNPTAAPTTDGNYRLLTNSNAVDVGDNASNTQTDDLDGSTRIQNSTIDLGPYEGETTVTTWQGTSSADWALGANWTDGVPSMAVSAIIPASASTQPEIDAGVTYEAKDITIENGATLTLKKDAFFTVDGNVMGTGDLIINSGGSVIVKGSSSATTAYKRTLNTTNDYWISSPVKGQDIDAFASSHPLANGPGANDRHLRNYSNVIDDWEYYQDGSTMSGNFQQGSGWSIQLTTAGDLTFQGDFPTSDVSVPLSTAATPFNVLGNPYPTSIAANPGTSQAADLLTLNKNVLLQQTLWLYDSSTLQFEAVNLASGPRYIPAGQGFVVAANGSGTFQFTETMQSHQTDVFQRSATNSTTIDLELTNGTDTRAATVVYRSDATTEFDNGFDSSVFNFLASATTFEFYTQLVQNNFGRKIEIQSLPDSNYETMIIPIGLKASNGETITLTAANITGIPSGYGIYVEDKNDNSFTSIGEAGESFEVTLSNDIDGAGRFFLHVSDQALSIDDEGVVEDKINFYVYQSTLKVLGVTEDNAQVRIYNILGQDVFNTSFDGDGNNEINLPHMKAGLYIIHVITKRGRVVKKVLKA